MLQLALIVALVIFLLPLISAVFWGVLMALYVLIKGVRDAIVDVATACLELVHWLFITIPLIAGRFLARCYSKVRPERPSQD